jgi:hypothetical protein
LRDRLRELDDELFVFEPEEELLLRDALDDRLPDELLVGLVPEALRVEPRFEPRLVGERPRLLDPPPLPPRSSPC